MTRAATRASLLLRAVAVAAIAVTAYYVNKVKPIETATRQTVTAPGQPVQGFSGIVSLGQDEFLTLTDNGFGSKANSPDAMLMFHIVRPDWKAGTVERVSTGFLHDPDRKVPFRCFYSFSVARAPKAADLETGSDEPLLTDKLVDVSPQALRMSSPFNAGYWLTAA